MKNLFTLLLICTVILVNSEDTSAQVTNHTQIHMISPEASGWFNQIVFRDGTDKFRHIITDHGGRDRLVIYPGYGGGAKREVEISGKIAVRTTNIPTSLGGRDLSNYSIFAKGGILTEELLVRTGWADYVFEDDYALMSLPDLRMYLEENNHLPNMPSASQVENNGLEIKDMTVRQQEKIEEAFLYILQMEEKMTLLMETVEMLEKEIEELKED